MDNGLPPLPSPGATQPQTAGARPREITKWTLARSMRLFPTALSPHSLSSPSQTLDFASVTAPAVQRWCRETCGHEIPMIMA